MTKITDKERPSLPKRGKAQNKGIVLLVASDTLGRGEDSSLGSLLIQKFLHTIPGLTAKPDTIIFINNGVKLAAESSAVLGELQLLEEQGIEMLACGTCLQRFELMGKIKTNRVSDMYTIANTIFNADKVVSIYFD